MTLSKTTKISLITISVILVLIVIIVPICVNSCPSKSAEGLKQPMPTPSESYAPYDPNKSLFGKILCTGLPKRNVMSTVL